MYIIAALVFGIIVNKKKLVTYCQQVLFVVKVFCVHKMFIALFVEYPLSFLLCHNLRLHMLKTCSIGKTVLSVSCARFKSHICKLRPPPPPTLRPRNPCICPCMNRRRRSTQISRLCPFSSRRQAEWTPVQASCWNITWEGWYAFKLGNTWLIFDMLIFVNFRRIQKYAVEIEH